jgi:hypothetical protein
MSLKHDNEILGGIQFILDAPPVAGASFSSPLWISGEDALDGDDYRIYTSSADADADVDLSASAKDAVRVAFSQPTPPPRVIVAAADGATTYLQALDAVREDLYVGWAAIDSRTLSDISTFGQGAATRKVGFVFQSGDGDFLTSDWPAAVSALESLEYNAVVFHPEDGEKLDIATIARNISPNADNFSRNWTGRIAAVDPYDSGEVTAAEYVLALANNVNLLAEFGGRPNWLYPGKMSNGRPASEIFSSQWFQVRLFERLARLFDRYDALNLKLPVSREGQEAVAEEVRGQFDQGVSAGHFAAGQLVITLPEITDTDRDEQRIPIEVALTFETGAIKILGSVSLSRQPVIEEDE